MLPPTPVNVDDSGVVRDGETDYRGYSLRETAGAPAVVTIYDGTSAAGPVLEEIALPADGSAQAFYPGRGVRAAAGLYVDVVEGAVTGSIRIG